VKRSFVALAFVISCGSSLGAQTIGSLPDQSPFTDLHDGQRLGVFAGMLITGKDVAGVNPKSAPMVGVRYDIAVGGPAYLTGSLFGASTTRTILDYTKSAATRNVGTQATGLVGANVALAVSATGERAWHNIQPLVDLGVGIMAAPGDKQDVSGYTFAPAFSFSYGVGVRWVTGRSSEFRADLNQYWWSLKYPQNYRSTQGDPIAIKPTGALSSWTANTALTVAWSLRVFR
jgi:hypothetical protein